MAASWPKNQKPLQGVVPPLITPLVDYDKIDEESTCKVLDHVIDNGVAGVFLLGTSGEFASLSSSLRIDFVNLCCRHVNGRVPVLVGITDCSFAVTIQLAKAAKDAGATALVLSTPFYYPLQQSEVKRYVERVLESVELPILLYNIPSLTKVWFEIDTLKALSTHPQIVGIKDSSGDLTGNLEFFKQICSIKEQRPDWSIFVGPDRLLPEAVKMGGSGGVNSGSNVLPELFVNLFKAARSEDKTQEEILLKRVIKFQDIYQVGSPGFSYLIAIKAALTIKGILKSDAMAEPLSSFQPNQRDRVRAILDEIPKNCVG